MKLPIGEPQAPAAALEVVRPNSRTSSEGQPVRNRVLLGLPDEEFASLCPLLTFEQLPRYTTLYEPGATMEFVYFLNGGLISILVVTRQGKTVEVGMVGKEGMAGTAALAGMSRSPHRVVMQIAGDGFRVRFNAIQSALSLNPHFQRVVGRCAVVQGMQAAQSAACNRLHGVEQRLARWLLTVHDRTDESSLHITHEFLAAVLGTDRPSISLAAGALQKKGAIEYTRGALRIANRERLEQSTCECYSIMQQFDVGLALR
jgi:CRP-like cAMP-binding protein